MQNTLQSHTTFTSLIHIWIIYCLLLLLFGCLLFIIITQFETSVLYLRKLSIERIFSLRILKCEFSCFRMPRSLQNMLHLISSCLGGTATEISTCQFICLFSILLVYKNSASQIVEPCLTTCILHPYVFFLTTRVLVTSEL